MIKPLLRLRLKALVWPWFVGKSPGNIPAKNARYKRLIWDSIFNSKRLNLL